MAWGRATAKCAAGIRSRLAERNIMKRAPVSFRRREALRLLRESAAERFSKERADPHPYETLAEFGQKGDIDIDLVPLIRELWRIRFITTDSCQSAPEGHGYAHEGLAYIGFYQRDAELFANKLTEIYVKYDVTDSSLEVTDKGRKTRIPGKTVHFRHDDIGLILDAIRRISSP